VRTDLRVSHEGSPGAYVGLIKRGCEVVWRCPHKHQNRDADTRHTAARRCANLVLNAVLDPDAALASIAALRMSIPHFQHDWQAREWQFAIQRLEWATTVADELRGQLGVGR
jgi:hypothetical protein